MKPSLSLLAFCGFETMLIIAFATCTALAQETTPSFEIVSPPACQNNKGEPVRFENQISPKAKSAAGMARRDDKGVPVIYRFAYAKSPQSLQKFIDRHECAHHQTGDIDRPHPPRNSPDHMMNESIADCIAILRMRDESTDSQAQIKNVTIALTQAMDAVGFPPSTIDSRISNIDNCAQKDGTAAEFIKAILDHRAAN
ncbi:hypothetical protein OAJ39_08580 [Alphaproteobacteria bacterium]|nr:hypothetical protein [Alphaproteobacteria bacterium]MDC0102431.1 hypothetical protein [Alphaproteobacteria bacterium]